MAYPLDRSAAISLDEQRVRRWIADFRKPERLDDPVMRALLRAYGRDPTGGPLDVGRRATQLLVETVESLEPPATASMMEQLPYRVMKVCFVEGVKNVQAASRLGVSERQLSRERTRAISLLTSTLAMPLAGARPLSSPPSPEGVVPRAGLWRRFGELVERAGRVHVYGAIGSGKTALVADYVRAAGEPAFWYRVIPGLNADLWGVLLDLGENLAPDDPRLAEYLDAALPARDLASATRIALTGLRRSSRIIVLDEFDALGSDGVMQAFLDEAGERLPHLKIITIGRRPVSGTSPDRDLHVPRLTIDDAAAIAEECGVSADDPRIRIVLGWTCGNAMLFDRSVHCLDAWTRSNVRCARRASSAQPARTLRGLVASSVV